MSLRLVREAAPSLGPSIIEPAVVATSLHIPLDDGRTVQVVVFTDGIEMTLFIGGRRAAEVNVVHGGPMD